MYRHKYDYILFYYYVIVSIIIIATYYVLLFLHRLLITVSTQLKVMYGVMAYCCTRYGVLDTNHLNAALIKRYSNCLLLAGALLMTALPYSASDW